MKTGQQGHFQKLRRAFSHITAFLQQQKMRVNANAPSGQIIPQHKKQVEQVAGGGGLGRASYRDRPYSG